MENIFTKRLKKLRKDYDSTQQELANYLEINRMTIVQWEKGNAQPNYAMLREMADYFNVNTSYLVGDDDFTLFLTIMADVYARIHHKQQIFHENNQITLADWITTWMPIFSNKNISEEEIKAEVERLGYKKEMKDIVLFYPGDYNTKIVEYIMSVDFVEIVPNGIKHWISKQPRPELFSDLIKEEYED